MATALRLAGERVVYGDEQFRDDTPDAEWLAQVGARRLVVLTKDKAIRRNYVERMAYLNAGVCGFFLSSGNLTGEDMAYVFISLLPRIKETLRTTPAPFLAVVSRKTIKLLPQTTGA